MNAHVVQPSLAEALEQVLKIARQIDAGGFSPEDRANVAVSYLVESSDGAWPLALQRQLLTKATAALMPSGASANQDSLPQPLAQVLAGNVIAQDHASVEAEAEAEAGVGVELGEKVQAVVPTKVPSKGYATNQPRPTLKRAPSLRPLPDGVVSLGKVAQPRQVTPTHPTVQPLPVAVPVAQPVEVPKPQLTPVEPQSNEATMPMLALANELIQDLTDILDFSDLAAQTRSEQETTIRDSIRTLSSKRKLHLNGREISDLINAVLDDMLGLGPLESLLADDSVTDIMVNGPYSVFVERGGKLELTAIKFRDNAHVFSVASRIVAAVGRRIDESQPMVDARLKDGSRVNVAVPPLAIDGPTITIRKFPSTPVKLERLVEGGSMSSQMAAFLGLAAFLRLNILVSGGTGSGKTTLMNAMSQYIPAGERIVTIEDAAELRFQQPHVVRFETRPPNVEGTGEVTMRTLVRNALRMRPDRIIIGEVRGDEVLDLLQAMNTGHDGSMSTLHANTPREALTRVESMAALAGFAPGGGVVRRQLVDAVHLVIQVSRMRDGKRRITSISEIAGIAGEAITLQELFAFKPDPRSTRTEVKGEYAFSGFRPKFASRATDYGVEEELNTILGI